MRHRAIHIERVTVGELYSFACQTLERVEPDETIPITKHLAHAQQHNPYAEKHDVALVVAYVGDRCAGYIGLIPGLLRSGERLSKVYWGSTLYVAPEYRSMGIGLLLIKNLLSLKCDFVGAEMSPMAEQVWRKLGLIGRLPARQCYILDSGKLNVAGAFLRWLQKFCGNVRCLSRVIERAINMSRIIFVSVKKFYYRLLYQSCASKAMDIRCEEVREINDCHYRAASNRARCEFHRGIEWINWKLKYRWFLNKEEVDVSYDNYHFRGVRDVFKIFAVEVYAVDEPNPKGFVVLSISIEGDERTIKILDYMFSDPVDAEYVFIISVGYGRQYLADRIIIPDTIAPYFERHLLTRYLLSSTKHLYICRPENQSSPLSIALRNIQLNFCDGDYSFT